MFLFNSWMLSNSWLLHRLYQSSNEALTYKYIVRHVTSSRAAALKIPFHLTHWRYVMTTSGPRVIWQAADKVATLSVSARAPDIILYCHHLCCLYLYFLTSGSLYWCIVLGSRKYSMQKCLYLKCVELYVMAWTPLKSLIFNISMSKSLFIIWLSINIMAELN